ncbi:MAG: shikimate kinase [Deinococcota bacterium]
MRALQLNVRELRQDYRQAELDQQNIRVRPAGQPKQRTQQTVRLAVSAQVSERQTEQPASLLRAASSQVASETHKPHIIAIDRPVTWIVLAGFMGAGKSRIGWELSRRLGLNFIDTDKVIERVSCLPVADIFEHYGEAVFRNYETEVVRRCLRLDYVVVSTGGGTVVRDINRSMLKSRGPVVLLSASAETTYQRTRRHKRPLLECDDPVQRIKDLMSARKAAYEDVASIRVSTDGRPSEEVVEEIVTKLWAWRETR